MAPIQLFSEMPASLFSQEYNHKIIQKVHAAFSGPEILAIDGHMDKTVDLLLEKYRIAAIAMDFDSIQVSEPVLRPSLPTVSQGSAIGQTVWIDYSISFTGNRDLLRLYPNHAYYHKPMIAEIDKSSITLSFQTTWTGKGPLPTQLLTQVNQEKEDTIAHLKHSLQRIEDEIIVSVVQLGYQIRSELESLLENAKQKANASKESY